MKSEVAHTIKHRQYANDEFMTPPELARTLISKVPILAGNFVIDPCPGKGAFLNSLPVYSDNIGLDEDFLIYGDSVDWIVTNPPYSDLDRWLEHSFKIAEVGVALLLGLLNVTPKRLELANRYGFGLTSMHLCKVFHWFGISAFCIWQKGCKDIVNYDRIVWR